MDSLRTYCPKCYATDSLDTAGRCTRCGADSTLPPDPAPAPAPALMGWECPRCHAIHSPFIQQCNCPPPCRINYASDTKGADSAVDNDYYIV